MPLRSFVSFLIAVLAICSKLLMQQKILKSKKNNKLKIRPADSPDKYSLSFTTGALFHRESVMLAQLYLDRGDWISVRDIVLKENLLQTRTMNTLKRVSSEIVSRLKTLSSDELQFLVDGSDQEQAYLLWLAVCRRYRFIADFAAEVVRERYISLKKDLTHEDYDSFCGRKSEWHSELNQISPATKGKLRQVLFKMLREAGLLSAENMINAAMLSPRLLKLIESGNSRDVFYLPIHDSELKGLSQ